MYYTLMKTWPMLYNSKNKHTNNHEPHVLHAVSDVGLHLGYTVEPVLSYSLGFITYERL
jgi:hypothetical protein